MRKFKYIIFLLLITTLSACGKEFTFKRHNEFVGYENKEIILYQDTKDNAVKFFEYEKFDFISYDDQTETVVLTSNDKLFVHNYKNGKKLYEIDLGRDDISSLETYKGKAAICFNSQEEGLIRLINLSKGETQDYPSNLQTSQAFLDDKYMYVAEGGDQYGEVYKMDLSSGEISLFVNKRFYRGHIDINRRESLIYVSEGGNSGELFYLNVEDSTIREINYSSHYKPIFFDGQHLHNSGNLYHSSSGRYVSGDEIYEKIENDKFKYVRTLLSNNLLTIIEGDKNNTFIYSKENNYLVYGFKANVNKAIEISKTKYLLACDDRKHVAIVDISKIKK